jgi:hypothetical protein
MRVRRLVVQALSAAGDCVSAARLPSTHANPPRPAALSVVRDGRAGGDGMLHPVREAPGAGAQ